MADNLPDAPWASGLEDAPWAKTPKTGAWESAGEGFLKGASANWRDEIYGASKASGLPDVLGGFRAPVGAAKLAYEHFTGERGPATEDYEVARDQSRQRQQLMQQEHPVAFGAGELGGAAGSMLAVPGGGAALPLAGRVMQGAKIGAGYGALAGAGEGEGLPQSAAGAAMGIGTGALGGAAGTVIGAGLEKGAKLGYDYFGRPLVSTMRGLMNPEAEAARRAAGAITRGADQVASGKALGMTEQQYAAAQAAGEPVMNLDRGGELTRALMRSSANTSPEGRALLTGAVQDRFEAQSERMGQAIRRMVAGGVNATKSRAQLLAEYDQTRIPAYRVAFAQPGAQSMWDEGFEQMLQAPSVQQAARAAMVNAKNEAAKIGLTPPRNPFVSDAEGRLTLGKRSDGSSLTPNLQFWDVVKKNLDSIGSRESQFWAKTLRDHLDQLVPKYADARGTAVKFFGGNNAIEAGEAATKFKGDPILLRQQMAKMGDPERDLFREGYASAMAAKVESTPDRNDITTRLFNSPTERKKIETVFGPNGVDAMKSMVDRETIFDAARKALGNSTTVRQMIEAGLAGGGIGAYLSGGDPMRTMEAAGSAAGIAGGAGAAGLARHGVITLARSGAQKVIGYVDQNTARRVAELLTSDDPAKLQLGLRIAASNKRVADGLRAIAAKASALMGSEQSVSRLPLKLTVHPSAGGYPPTQTAESKAIE